jgi:hypothetical protein
MANVSEKSKADRIVEIIIILFVVAGVLLSLADISSNIRNEMVRRQDVAQGVEAGTPALPTMSEEQYQQLIQTPRPGW